MNYSSPFTKDWKVKKDDSDKPLDKFKPIKPILSTKVGKELVERSCSPQELLWIERWLDNLVRSHSYPPQIAGKDAFNSLTMFLGEKALQHLGDLRQQFLASHPQHQAPKEDFQFLLEAMEPYHELQSQSLPSSHNNQKPNDVR
jgi:hypothetical protein